MKMSNEQTPSPSEKTTGSELASLILARIIDHSTRPDMTDPIVAARIGAGLFSVDCRTTGPKSQSALAAVKGRQDIVTASGMYTDAEGSRPAVLTFEPTAELLHPGLLAFPGTEAQAA